ncbi:hypothetical protein ACL6C3_28170 [Capilliphycus salinus ALCB114379]
MGNFLASETVDIPFAVEEVRGNCSNHPFKFVKVDVSQGDRSTERASE